MKWWGQKIFKDTQEVTKGHSLSAPPAKADYAQWNVPLSLQDDVSFANKVTFGERGQKWQLEQHRICWYVCLETTDQPTMLSISLVNHICRGQGGSDSQ